MTAEIITIGDEILIGQIVDTNSAFISKELNKIGIDVRQIISIQDEKAHILSSLKNAAEKSEIVIITGGLGPTNDDITKQTLCGYFKDELVLCKEALVDIEKIFAAYSSDPISDLNRNQAMLPSRAIPLLNKYGTAPGMWFDENDRVYISLPGVPFEMKELLVSEVLPRLQERFERPFIIHKTILTYGIGESALAEKIEAWENALPAYIKLAYLPGLGFVRLRLSARGNNEQLLKDNVATQVNELHKLIDEHIKGYEDEDSMEVRIAKLLTEQHKTLATVESCTGGKIASVFTENPGASAYFKGSIVSYATSVKEKVLNVPKAIIDEYSVVSAETAKIMAIRGREMLEADYVLATTGNAGPTKGDSDAEIGRVYIALATPNSVECFSYSMGNHREKVLAKTVSKSLEILWEELF